MSKKGNKVTYLLSRCHPLSGVQALWNENTRVLELQCAACRRPVGEFESLRKGVRRDEKAIRGSSRRHANGRRVLDAEVCEE